ncbi:MAG: hypothetical protein HOF72_07270, partial [Planctomycetaceae bacterium]|nr:hypothetical protein [Planctomycetaceae bacterium]
MKRRDFLATSMATALFPVGSNWADALARGLPARALDGSDMILPASHIEALAADMRGKIILPGTHGYDK